MQSKTIQERLQTCGEIPSEILYPPPPLRNYRTEAYESYVFAVSRLHPLKRLDLLVRAMKQVKTQEFRAVIAGTGEEQESLQRLAATLGVGERVDFIGRIDEETLLQHYARCRAVFFAPFMEDYGLVTIEAFRSRKAVITCIDSGGPAELVVDNCSGFVTLPDPTFIAERLDRLAESKELAAFMGARAEQETRGITWESALGRLML